MLMLFITIISQPTLPVSCFWCSVIGCLRHFKTCETLHKHIHRAHPNLPASAATSLHSSSSHQLHSATLAPTAALSFSTPVLQHQNSFDLANLMTSLDTIILPPSTQPPTTQPVTQQAPSPAAFMTYEQQLYQVEQALLPPSTEQLVAEQQAALLGHRMASLHQQLNTLELTSMSASSEQELLRHVLAALRDEQLRLLRQH
jgi:hypothetical protein